MTRTIVWTIVAVLMLSGAALATDLRDKVKVEVEGTSLHPGMEPGMYVCALGHLHITGSVQNLAGVALGHVKLAGRALDAQGKVLGTAVSSTKPATLAPGEKTEFDLEFLTVTGPSIQQVKRHEISVVEAPAKG